jgi:hypothetical protein
MAQPKTDQVFRRSLFTEPLSAEPAKDVIAALPDSERFQNRVQ